MTVKPRSSPQYVFATNNASENVPTICQQF